MSFKQPDLTSGSRPILAQDETLLFVQNNVGLYGGKFKIADSQTGHAYLTSHRVCYVDDKDPRGNSLAIDLKDVSKHDYQAGFLRSSPKVTIHLKPQRKSASHWRQNSLTIPAVHRLQSSASSVSSPGSRTSSPFRPGQIQRTVTSVSSGSWVCPICTFTNPVPSNFDPTTASQSTSLPPCLTCGIAPPLTLVLKAAISANADRSNESTDVGAHLPSTANPVRTNGHDVADSHIVCPKCTFHNHPSLQSCELCGAPLYSRPRTTSARQSLDLRSASPAPEISDLNMDDSEEFTSIKISFRSGGDKVFFERLKAAMIQRKWIAANVPAPNPLNNIGRSSEPSSPTIGSFGASTPPNTGRVGIAGLEQRGFQSQNKNELVIGAAFEDIEALMSLNKEVVALARNLAKEYGDNATDSSFDYDASEETEQGMIATKDMLTNTSDKLYISELARNLAEYVTDEKRGILRKQGGTMSLIDLWAAFNRSRDGVELVSPSDFHKAALAWTTLGLPVRLRQFRSGLLAVQRSDMNDDKVIAQLRKWLETFKMEPLGIVKHDWQKHGCGVTAQDAAKRFGWSLGIATEELEMAEEKGALCREESIEGLKFWLNDFNQTDDYASDDL